MIASRCFGRAPAANSIRNRIGRNIIAVPRSGWYSTRAVGTRAMTNGTSRPANVR